VSASDVISAAEYQWKQIAVNVVASGLELRNNAGSKTRILNLVKSRMTNAIRSFKNGLSTDLYSDGTASNQINGLQALINDTVNTGTIGGIDSSTFTFWSNAVQDASSPLSGSSITLSATTFEQPFMLQLYLELSRGNDQPDLIVLSNDYYTFFEGSQVSLKRYSTDTGPQSGKAGFVSLKYKKADVVFDGGTLGGGIPSAHGYMINTNFMELVVHKDANMTEVPEMRSVNQDAVVMPINTSGVTIH